MSTGSYVLLPQEDAAVVPFGTAHQPDHFFACPAVRSLLVQQLGLAGLCLLTANTVIPSILDCCNTGRSKRQLDSMAALTGFGPDGFNAKGPGAIWPAMGLYELESRLTNPNARHAAGRLGKLRIPSQWGTESCSRSVLQVAKAVRG